MTEQAPLISARLRITEIGPAGHWILQEQPRQILDADPVPHPGRRVGDRFDVTRDWRGIAKANVAKEET